jgi:hypothetical protein
MIPGRNSPFLDGILLIQHDLKLVTLLDVSERILDSRGFLPGEVFKTGGLVLIRIFLIRISLVPLNPSSLFPSASNGGPPCPSPDLAADVLGLNPFCKFPLARSLMLTRVLHRTVLCLCLTDRWSHLQTETLAWGLLIPHPPPLVQSRLNISPLLVLFAKP